MKINPIKSGVWRVFAYAADRSNQGWDLVTETYDDDEVAELVTRLGVDGTLAHLANEVGLYYEAGAEARAVGHADVDAPAFAD